MVLYNVGYTVTMLAFDMLVDFFTILFALFLFVVWLEVKNKDGED